MIDPIGGIYNATAPTVSDGGQTQLQVDASGNLKVAVGGSSSGGGGAGFSAGVSDFSFTRPNDTAAYTAGDVVGATTATGGAVLSLTGFSAGETMVTTVKLAIATNTVASGQTSFRMHLYNVTPPSALADNAAWDLAAADLAAYMGYVDLGSPADLGTNLYVETTQYNKQMTSPGATIFAYLVTAGTYTPAAQTVLRSKLHYVKV